MEFTNTSNKAVVHEITAEELESDTGHALRQHMIDGEKVHPIRQGAAADWLKRLAKNLDLNGGLEEKHCYGLYAPGASLPSLAVYVRLLKLPTKERTNINGLKEVLVEDAALPGNIADTLYSDNYSFLDFDPNTAIFYSISSFSDPKMPRTAVDGKRPGAFLIKGVAEMLKRDFGVMKFSTLSPLRQKTTKPDGSVEQHGFRVSLRQRLLASDHPEHFFTKAEAEVIEALYPKVLNAHDTSPDIGIKFLALAEHQGWLSTDDRTKVHSILRALALDYLITVVRSGQKEGVDGVEDFHLGNGAKIGNIHVKPRTETTEHEWDYAFGVMVNYVYELEQTATRSTRYKSASPEVPASPAIMAEYRTRQSQLMRDHPKEPYITWVNKTAPITPGSPSHR